MEVSPADGQDGRTGGGAKQVEVEDWTVISGFIWLTEHCNNLYTRKSRLRMEITTNKTLYIYNIFEIKIL